MIETRIDAAGDLHAQQQLVSPSVYLDHWALRAVSRDRALGDRFTRALEARGGTLVLSWAHVAEFPRLDLNAAHEAEEFIEGNLPRVFFMDFNAFDVIQRENAILAGGPLVPPHADLDLMRLVVLLRPSGPVTCRGMLAEVSGQRLESHERMKAIFVERITELREIYLADDQFRGFVASTLRDRAAPRGTFVVLREIVGGLLRDATAPIRPNDAMDFFHAIVPVSYCDFALLDGRWRDQVERLGRRLRQADVHFPLATVLSGGVSAVEALVEILEES